jgi:GAF domain-containing protein
VLAAATGTAARVGGGEFAVLLPATALTDAPAALLARWNACLGAPIPTPAGPLPVVLNVGMALAELGTDLCPDADSLLALAAGACLRSRCAGRPVLACESRSGADAARVSALRSYDVHDPALDEALRAVAEVAAIACGTTHAFVTFVDSDLHWVRAAAGGHLPPNPDNCTPRHLTLCDHVVRRRRLLEIPDTELDARYRVSRHAAWQIGIRFYAGAPLVAPDGSVIGVLSVVDLVPGALTARRRRSLSILADETMAILEVHKATPV